MTHAQPSATEERADDSDAFLEQLRYAFSHDLTEPVRCVSSYTELLQQRMPAQTDPKIEKYVRHIRGGAERMQGMVEALSDCMRIETQPQALQPVELQPLVQSVVRNLRDAIQEANATIDIGVLPAVLGARLQLKDLFRALLLNALTFRQDPCQIRISADWSDADTHRLSVQDNGIGIDLRNHQRIFELFQRGCPGGTYPGCGAGLAIAARIVRRHGGNIWVESTLGEGATFFVELRRVDQDASVAVASET